MRDAVNASVAALEEIGADEDQEERPPATPTVRPPVETPTDDAPATEQQRAAVARLAKFHNVSVEVDGLSKKRASVLIHQLQDRSAL